MTGGGTRATSCHEDAKDNKAHVSSRRSLLRVTKHLKTTSSPRSARAENSWRTGMCSGEGSLLLALASLYGQRWTGSTGLAGPFV